MNNLMTNIDISAFVKYSDTGVVTSVTIGRSEVLPLLSDDEIIRLQEKWVNPPRSMSPTPEDYTRHMDKVAAVDYKRLLMEVVK